MFSIEELDSWSDIVNVLLNVSRDVVSVLRSVCKERIGRLYILVTRNSCFASISMLVNMVLGLKQRFEVEGRSIKLHPLLVDRLRNLIRGNTSRHKPLVYSIDCRL